MTLAAWLGVALALTAAGIIIYWLLVITEGTYLGQPIVTWMYDLVARRYNSIKGFDADIEAAYLGRPLAAELAVRKATTLLDVGTGTGRLPLALIDQPRFQGRIVGIDASERMLLIAAEKLTAYGDRCWLVHQSAMRLPFVSESFDAVTLLEMLEFTPDPVAVLREAVRVLRPGGVLLTTRRRGFDARLMPGKTYSEAAFVDLLSGLELGKVRVQRWQVDYDLVWAERAGMPLTRFSHPLEALACLECGKAAYDLHDSHLICGACRHNIQVRDGIIRMNS